MSKKQYSKNPWVMRTVKYKYMLSNEWREGSHICYEKTDEKAIESAYDTVLWSKLDSFLITEVVTKVYQ